MSERHSESNVYEEDLSIGWNGEYFRKLRLDLLNGVENPNCHRCWQANIRNIASKRTQSNHERQEQLEDPKFLQALEDCKNNDGKFSLPPDQLDIKINNTCNLKCMMCNTYQSSSHEAEVKLMRKQDIKIPRWLDYVESILGDKKKPVKQSTLTNSIKSALANLRVLLIDGGEPMTSPDLEEILDYCIENGHTGMMLGFVTNLTKIPDGILDKLDKFWDVRLWVSWDHYEGDKFKFIRYPANYDHFLANFEMLKKYPRFRIGISLAISIFNVYDMPKLLDHFEELAQQGYLRDGVLPRLVHAPDYLSMEYLEPEQKAELNTMFKEYLEKNKDYLIFQDPSTVTKLKNSEVILTHEPVDFLDVVKERTRVLKLYDPLRNTDYKAMCPYIKDYE
jgi:pyruvate-formate lyase-activating enzyme